MPLGGEWERGQTVIVRSQIVRRKLPGVRAPTTAWKTSKNIIYTYNKISKDILWHIGSM